MNYVTHADLGGRPGFGRVLPEAGEPLFHHAWEARVLAITVAMGAAGLWNLDMSRSARETLPNYLALSYYEIWFEALCKLLAQAGVVAPDEIAAGRPLHPAQAIGRRLDAQRVPAALAAGSPTLRSASAPARFVPGARVRCVAASAPHHTRLPGYARGKTGVVARVNGAHVFPDANAQRLGEDPRWLYTVTFAARDLWPGDTSDHTVSIDAWEPYLEPA